MDMCYNGKLVMPSSYAIMNEEEMTYTEGGDITTLKNNLYGLYNLVINYMAKYISGATIGAALKRCGLSWSQIGQLVGSYSSLAAKVVAGITSLTKWLGSHAVIIGVVSGAAGFAVLWNFEVF